MTEEEQTARKNAVEFDDDSDWIAGKTAQITQEQISEINRAKGLLDVDYSK